MSGGSLNAGNELEDDVIVDGEEGVLSPEFLFPDAEPGEIPELEQDITILSSMDAALESLIDLKTDIVATGGMHRNFALEAERLLPGALSTPAKHFSNVPSATGFKVSVEEITSGMWALIAAASAAIIGLIWKIVSWWTGGSKESKPTNNDIKKAAEEKVEKVHESQDAISEARDDMDEVQHLVHNYPIEWKTMSGHTMRYTSLDTIIAQLFTDDTKYARARKLLEHPDPIHWDMINNGPYSQLIKKLANTDVFHSSHEQLLNKVRELKELHFDDMALDGSITPGIQRRLDILKKPVEVKFNGALISLDNVARHLSNARTSAKSVEPKTNIHFDNMFKTVDESAKNDSLVKAIKDAAGGMEAYGQMSDALDKLQKEISNVSQDGNPGRTTEGIAQAFREVLPAVKDDLAAYANIVLELDRFTTQFNMMATLVVGFSTDIVLKVTREIKLTGAEVPKEWVELKKKRSAALKALEKKHFPGADMSHLRD